MTEFIMAVTFSLMSNQDMSCLKVSGDVYECHNEKETCLIQQQTYRCSPNEYYFRVFEGEML